MKKNSDASPELTVDFIEKLRSRLSYRESYHQERVYPVITLTFSQSIDGCIAPFGGGTLQLSNAKSRQLTHRIRSLHDAILVGVNTVLCDDPLLTVRFATGNNPQPIVLDSRLRFPLGAKLLRDPCVRPIIATGENSCVKKEKQLTDEGARVIRVVLQADGVIDLAQFLPLIKKMGIHSVMVEGGSKVITNFLKSQLVDQILLSIVPRFIGGLHAVGSTPDSTQLPEIEDVQYQSLDGDLIVWGRLKPRSDSAGITNS